MTVEDEYIRVLAKVKNKICFQLVGRLVTLKGELMALGIDYVYFQGMKDRVRLYRMLTGVDDPSKNGGKKPNLITLTRKQNPQSV